MLAIADSKYCMARDLEDYDAWELVEVAVARRLERREDKNQQSAEQFAAMAAQRAADDKAGQGGPPVLGKKK